MTAISLVLLSLLGAVIAAVVGTVWYSPATPMGRLHMKYVGCDNLTKDQMKKKMEEAKPMMPKMYLAQTFLSLLTSFAVVFVVSQSLRSGLTLGMALGFVAFNWLCFMVPVVGSGIIWGNCDRKLAWKKFFSDILFNLVIVLLVGLMTSFFV